MIDNRQMRTLLFALGIAAAGCGNVNQPGADAATAIDAEGPAPDACVDCTMQFGNDSGWDCPSNVDCVDVYDFETFDANAVTVTVTAVTGSSCPRLALFAGSAATGTNLMNAGTTDVCQLTQDTDLMVGPVTMGAPGHYQLTVGRDWGFSGGAAGTYTVDATFTRPVIAGGQQADDVASSDPPCN
jgi:hypothetical protein